MVVVGHTILHNLPVPLPQKPIFLRRYYLFREARIFSFFTIMRGRKEDHLKYGIFKLFKQINFIKKLIIAKHYNHIIIIIKNIKIKHFVIILDNILPQS